MNLSKRYFLAIAAMAASNFLPKAGATVITQWNFPAVVTTVTNSPAPTSGTGTAVSLGMTNTYSYTGTTATNSVTSDDIPSTPGVADSSFTENTWRIRGVYQSTGTAPNNGTVSKSSDVNGWNLSAPQYTQGAEFDVPTTGYQNITVNFDWFCTNAGVRDLQEQYTVDGTDWININPLQVAVPNDYDGTSTSPTTTIDLSSIAGANNDPTFGIRLVSAYDPTYTGTGSPTYTAATLVSGAPVQYDNNSGNWRFGDITFSGTAIPEPTGLTLLAAIALPLIGRRRKTV